jgi:hypothetical protein
MLSPLLIPYLVSKKERVGAALAAIVGLLLKV